jgi:very-short-patch-repair endonuclease
MDLLFNFNVSLYLSYYIMNKRVIQRNMFYGASKKIFLRAIELRNNMTPAENLLWKVLKNKEIFKVRFKRQHPVSIFVVDFYCHKYKLAIEVDGDIHLRQEVMERDDGRTHDIEKLGIKILRFTNQDVIEKTDWVKDSILNEISSHSTSEV